LNEIEIELSEVNPQDFFGEQNKTIIQLRAYFPKLKIIARGNKIKALGEEEVLEEFEKRVDMLVAHYGKFNSLDAATLELILSSDGSRDYEATDDKESFILHGLGGKVIKAKTFNQQRLVQLSKKNDMLFAIGPAAGENLGFLPGDMKEKLDPYMQPLYDALRDMIPAERLASYIEKGTIQIAPLAFMRGRTLDNAFVILDEAQNTTHAQMKMFLTRMGPQAKFIITGDPGQIDLPRRVISGLKEALLILKETKGIGMLYLDDRDVIRHRLVKKVIDAYKHIEHQN